MDPFYKIILEAMISDTEASLRMLEDVKYMDVEARECVIDPKVVPVKSSLRRAIKDAKEAMRGFEE